MSDDGFFDSCDDVESMDHMESIKSIKSIKKKTGLQQISNGKFRYKPIFYLIYIFAVNQLFLKQVASLSLKLIL